MCLKVKFVNPKYLVLGLWLHIPVWWRPVTLKNFILLTREAG
jgi:hypothetical protein